jgi:hypothetical protein
MVHLTFGIDADSRDISYMHTILKFEIKTYKSNKLLESLYQSVNKLGI